MTSGVEGQRQAGAGHTAVTAGVSPATLLISFSEVGHRTSESDWTRVPKGPWARDVATAFRGQAGSRPQGTSAWVAQPFPLPGSDPGPQHSRGHSSLGSGDARVRPPGGESRGGGQGPGSSSALRQAPVRAWDGSPALQSLDATSGPSHPKPFMTLSGVFCPEVAGPVHIPRRGLWLGVLLERLALPQKHVLTQVGHRPVDSRPGPLCR